MTISSSALPAVGSACPLGQISSAAELAEIHRSSVIRHAQLLAAPQQAKEKIRDYFTELKNFLIDHQFRGCPYTNAVASVGNTDKEILKEVRDHKEFIREFFVNLSLEVTSKQRATRMGEHLFLLYSGATTESQNLQQVWPIESALQAVNEVLTEEESLRTFESGIL